jgi:hypothetical protein
MTSIARRFALALGMIFCAISTGARAQNSLTNGSDSAVEWLVTPAEAREFRGEDAYNEQPALRARSVVPLIDIVKPEPAMDLKVKAPFPIVVQFKGQQDSAIEPATFKVLYGFLKIDITDRITKFVKVTKEGFALDKANIPVGKHRLTLQVADDKQRIAERELRVEVE